MNKRTLFPVITLLVMSVLNSCEDKKFQTYTANVPEYMSYDDLRKSITAESPREISRPGKIYFKGNTIYINEFMEGVHVVDITDPASPEQIAYIPVAGNVDMAIKDDILYLDSYTDLVLVDISDPASPFEERRIEDILEYTLPPYDPDYPVAQVDQEEGVVTGWVVKEFTQEIQNNPYPWPMYAEWNVVSFDMSSVPRSGGGAAAGSAYGVGGSMARFLTYDDYLYMLQTDYKLKVVDITQTDTLPVKYDKYIGSGLETMFIYNDYMYIGSTQGMHILSLEDPDSPFKTAEYRHITSCDPVVVNGNYAYVTLRSGNLCGGTADLLEVIDISDKYDPQLIASYNMDEPYGLGISGTTLFVCQGPNGLMVYDASSPTTIDENQLASFSDIQSKDVIPVGNFLFMIGEDGFYIYDYTDINNITLTGSIPVTSEE